MKWFIPIMLLLAFPLSAQELLLNIKQLSTKDGLSSRLVFCVLEDLHGFMWVGSQSGLSRYDGTSFTFYSEEKGLKKIPVSELYNDKDSLVWIEYNDHSIDLLNPSTQEVCSFETYFGKEIAFDAVDIISLFNTEENVIYFKTNEGHYYRYDGQKNCKLLWKGDKNSREDLKYFYQDEDKTTWIHEGEHCFLINEDQTLRRTFYVGDKVDFLGVMSDGRGLVYEHKDSSFIFYVAGEEKKDSSKKRWALNTLRGVNFRTNQKYRRRQFICLEKQLLWLQHKKKSYLFENTVIADVLREKAAITSKVLPEYIQNVSHKIQHSKYKDRLLLVKSNYYRGAWSIGMVDLELNYFKTFPKTKGEHSIRSIVMDANDNLYVQNYNIDVLLWKKERYVDTLESFRTYVNALEGRGLSSILSRDRQAIWMGTENAKILRFNPKTKEMLSFESCLPNQSANTLWGFWSLYEDTGGELWIGSKKGVYQLDTTNGCLVPYVMMNEFTALGQSTVMHFHANDKGLWAATSKGLFLIDKEKGVIEHYHSKAGSGYYIPYDYITHIHQTNEGEFWLATRGGGIIRLDLQSKKSRQYTAFKDGLSSSNTHAIYADDFNNLWISSDRGLMQLNRSTNEMITYLSRDGLPSDEFNRSAHYQDKDGFLYFGGVRGFIKFHPKHYRNRFEEKRSIPLKITKYSKWDKENGKELDVTPDLLKTGRVYLSTNDVFINFKFMLLDYKDLKDHQYAYYIDGYTKDWIITSENFIRLSGLPIGEYKLIIKGRTMNSEWESDQIEIKLIVPAPFYKKWWFWGLLLGGGIGLILIYYKARIQVLSKRNKLLEDKIELRTEEIRKDKKMIEEQAQKLQKINALKSKFFANISHEIRTPLTLITAPLEDVLEQAVIKEATNVTLYNSIRIAYKNSKKLKRMVDEILLLSKLDVNKLEIEAEPVRLLPFLKQVYKSFEYRAQLPGNDYRFITNISEEAVVTVDWRKVERILYNLLSNAFKYTPKDGQILFCARIERANFLEIEIADKGEGIHVNDIHRIFDRYYQSKESSMTKGGGTGIGLSLSKEFAALLGGELSVKSKQGAGSVFRLVLPIEHFTGKFAKELFYFGREGGVVEEEPLLASVKYSPDTKAILLVEDNTDLQLFLKRLLSRTYQVVTAANGQDALDVLAKERRSIDLIVSDIMMPKMDGFQFAQKIKSSEEWKNIPLVLLSARAELSDKLNGLRIGVDDYIVKPFDTKELLARVENLLSNYESRQSAIKEEQNLLKEGTIEPLSKQDHDLNWLMKVEETAIALIKEKQGHFNLPDFTEKIHISERQFRRKIKLLVGLTPNQYLREIRLKIAKDYLELGEFATVHEVASAVGFSTSNHFSKLYEERFGKRPIEYLKN